MFLTVNTPPNLKTYLKHTKWYVAWQKNYRRVSR